MSDIVLLALILFICFMGGAAVVLLLLFNMVPCLGGAKREGIPDEPAPDDTMAQKTPVSEKMIEDFDLYEQERMLEEWVYGNKQSPTQING